MRTLTKLGIPVLAAILTACATPDRDLPSISQMLRDTTEQNGRACVRKSDLRGYAVLKNDILSIDGRRSHYLATVHPGCPTLATSARLIFAGDFYEICGRSMDRVVSANEQCTINQMFEFDNREAAFEAYHSILERREELRKQARDSR